jgi:excisionase family DNA binding protein
MIDRALLTTRQVAEYLVVPISTIHRWQYVGTGPPAIRVGRHLRFDRADLDDWIERQKTSPPHDRVSGLQREA